MPDFRPVGTVLVEIPVPTPVRIMRWNLIITSANLDDANSQETTRYNTEAVSANTQELSSLQSVFSMEEVLALATVTAWEQLGL